MSIPAAVLQFRRADRFVTDILNVASNGVWPLLARNGYADGIADPESITRLRREHQSHTALQRIINGGI